jgi:hypothetical protein
MYLNNKDLVTFAYLITRDGQQPELAKKIADLLKTRIEETDRTIDNLIALKEELHDAELAVLETFPND